MSEKRKEVCLKNNIFNIIVISLSGSFIYALPYLKNYFYDDYMQMFGLTNTQMGLLGTVYGFVGVCSYFLGGILADKFSAKKLLVLSLILTSIGGILHMFTRNFTVLLAIYILWGISSLCLLWSPLVKVLRMQARDDEQSKAYGVFETTRGFSNSLYLAIATAIFGIFVAKSESIKGLNIITIFYTIIPIVCALLLLVMIKEQPVQVSEKSEENKLSMKNFKLLLKMPATWLITLITFTTYVFHMSYFYFTPFATNILGTSAVLAAVFTVLSQYCRPFSMLGGYLADKLGRSKMLMFGFLGESLGVIIFIGTAMLPTSIQIPVAFVGAVVVYVSMYFNYSIYITLISEGGIPLGLTGTAVGIISTIGYAPEMLVPLVAGRILDTIPGVKGYYVYFSLAVACGLIGFVLSFIWYKKYGKEAHRKQVEEKNKNLIA